jgi:hypothetical protein
VNIIIPAPPVPPTTPPSNNGNSEEVDEGNEVPPTSFPVSNPIDEDDGIEYYMY